MKILIVADEACNSDGFLSAASRLREGGESLDLLPFIASDLDRNERLFQAILMELANADLLILRLHGGVSLFNKFERLVSIAEGGTARVFVQSAIPEEVSDYRHLSKLADEQHAQVRAYLELGGADNERALLLWALHYLGGAQVDVPEPIRPRTEGIYHPNRAALQDDSAFIEGVRPGRPTIGIMFPQADWLSGNTITVDALIRHLESKGANALPLFFTSSPSPISGSLGINDAVRKYFVSDGMARVDAVILLMGFSQLCLSRPGDGGMATEKTNIFAELDVPVVHGICMMGGYEAWRDSPYGLDAMEIAMNVFWPEYDGQIISVPVSSTERGAQGIRAMNPIADRIDALAELALNWAKLRRTPRRERKVAVLMHQNPPRNDMIGGAFGLDAPESVVGLLNKMKDAGYGVDGIPATGQDLTREILAQLTNDSEWLSVERMRDKAADIVPESEYDSWFEVVPEGPRERMRRDWGDPPGELMVVDQGVVIPGVAKGNVFVGLQPSRGRLERSQELYHSQESSMPHSYLAYYRWLVDGFGAQAVVHMGTHGTLEWLPGKSVGLSRDCFPDIAIANLPHLYPYVIGNPGEGMQAKRRSAAVIVDHLVPALARADGYEDLAVLETVVQEFLVARGSEQAEKSARLLEAMMDRMRSCSLMTDIGLESSASPADVAAAAGRIYDYLCQVKDNLIKDGLHVLGRPPEGKKLEEVVYSLTRLPNGKVPSLREAMGELMGVDLKRALASPSALDPLSGKPNGALVDEVDGNCRELIHGMIGRDFQIEKCIDLLEERYGEASDDLRGVARYICESIVPNLQLTSEECTNLLHGLDGRYVRPGPSGCITRGNAHLLPTGRNFFSIDPAGIPSRSSFEVGREMAEQMLERYVREKGCYPRNVGMVVFATDTMKTGGDDIAYILWLLGLRPVWTTQGGRVAGLEVVPIAELGRPRIDVTVRITGLFRDSFPNLIEMLDEGMEAIAGLDEGTDENYFLANLREDIATSIANGLEPLKARRMARVRIFGCPPGDYGGGVDILIGTTEWKSRSDLADAYLSWGGYAYGKDLRGESMHSQFKNRLTRMDVTVKNHESRELDTMETDDDFIYLGGMNAAVEAFKGEQPLSMMGDSSDPEAPRLRTVAEEGKFIFRSRVLNPKWLEGLKEHGYRGAQEVSSLFDFAFGWDATSDILDDWMYESMAEKFILDLDTQEWIQENNPDALMKMTSRMLEAADRGLWKADEDTLQKLRSIFMEAEGALEGIRDEERR